MGAKARKRREQPLDTRPSDRPARAMKAPGPLVLDALVIAPLLIVFGPSLGNAFVWGWDDGRFLASDLVTRPSWSAFVSIVSQPQFEAYQPLHLLSYWIDVPLSHASPVLAHVVSLALFALAMLALRRALTTLGLTPVFALLATLLVALHPAQVEAVVWATGRKDVLMMLFASLALLAHLKSTRPFDEMANLSRLAFVAACLSKSAAMPLPIFFALLDVTVRGKTLKDAVLAQLPSLGIAAIVGLVVYGLWGQNELVRSRGTSALLIAHTYTHQLRTAFVPLSLSPLYPIAKLEDLHVIALLGPTLLAICAAIAFRTKQPWVVAAALGFAVLLSPTSNVVPLYFQVNDRYLCLPLFAIAIGVAAILERAGRFGAGIFSGLLLCLALLTGRYAAAWDGDVSLFRHATHEQPSAFYAWMKLGEALREAGDFDEAIDAYDHAIRLEPTLRLAHTARFVAIARRDEDELGLTPSRALAVGERVHAALSDAAALREIGVELLSAGYRGAVLDVLDRSLAIDPLPDARLETAARHQHGRGNDFLARYYVSRMSIPPNDPALRALAQP